MADKNRVALYARVSTKDQDAQAQMDRLVEWARQNDKNVVMTAVEYASGRLVRRPKQDEIMKAVRGHRIHEVVVVKLDRWGRSLIDLKNSVNDMVDCGVIFRALDSGVTYEKHTPTGKLFLHQLAAFAEFEADLISERTKEGLESRRRAGVKLGRPLDPCFQCEGPRTESIRGKRGGRLVPLCGECKGAGRKRE